MLLKVVLSNKNIKSFGSSFLFGTLVLGCRLATTSLCFKQSNICVSVINQVGYVLKVNIGLQDYQAGCRNIGWRITRLVVILKWENTGVRFSSPQKKRNIGSQQSQSSSALFTKVKVE